MGNDLEPSCETCGQRNGVSIDSIFKNEEIFCYSCNSPLRTKQIKLVLTTAPALLIYLLAYVSLEYYWYNKNSSIIREAVTKMDSVLPNYGRESVIDIAKKKIPSMYSFNPFKYGSYYGGKKNNKDEFNKRMNTAFLNSSKNNTLTKDWKNKRKVRFYKWFLAIPFCTLVSSGFYSYIVNDKTNPIDSVTELEGDYAFIAQCAGYFLYLLGAIGFGAICYYIFNDII